MGWSRFFRRSQKDAELVSELEAHIAHEVDDNMARGMDAEEARRQAYLKFGNPTRVREDVWRMNSFVWLENLLRDARYAWRVLLRNPGYALVAVLTMGLGIGANTAIFTVINGVLLKPLPYPHQEQILHVEQTAPKLGPEMIGLSVQELMDYRGQSRSFSNVAEYHSMLFTLLGTKDPKRVVTGVVSANYFDVLGVKPLLGRLILPSDESMNAPPVLVLSYGFWIKEFGGDRNIIGRSFEMNDRVHTVVGVLQPLPDYPDANDVYMPTSSCPYRSDEKMMAPRDMRMITAYARLKPGVTLQQARTELKGIVGRFAAAYPQFYHSAETGFTVQAIPVEKELTHAARPTFLTLLGASGLVLLLACANLANLALSRHMRRSREIAVRMATGASTWRIFRQILTESLMVAMAGGIVGIVIAAAGSRLLIAYAARMTPLADAVHLDGWVLLFGLGISLASGMLFGALPGYIACRIRPVSLTEAGTRAAGSEGGTRMRNVLVAAQVTLSFVLLMCAGLMLRSLYNLLSVDPGFKPANVLSLQVSLNWTKYGKQAEKNNFLHQAVNRIEALPGVDSASASINFPLNSDMGSMGNVLIDGQPNHTVGPESRVGFEGVGPDYFRVLGVPVLSGRAFSALDKADAPPVAIVNLQMAEHYWPHENPVGHRVSGDNGKTWLRVVGVVNNIHEYGLDKGMVDELYVPEDQNSVTEIHLLVRTRGNPLDLARPITQVIHGMDPQQPVTNIRTLAQIRSTQLSTPRMTTMLLGLFAMIALFITIVGVSGTLALSVARRSKEIGIRMALGATKGDILRNVLGQGMVPVVVGLGLGMIVSLLATRVLTGILFKVKADDPVTFVMMATVFVVVAVIGCMVPARRAVEVDPMVALRME